MKTAMVLFYPNTYAETCCTSILESMAYGCNIISSDLGAISETSNGFSTLLNPNLDKILDINYDTQNAFMNPISINELPREYIDLFIDKTIKLVNNYYSDENLKLLKEQYNYITSTCKWSDRIKMFNNIINN